MSILLTTSYPKIQPTIITIPIKDGHLGIPHFHIPDTVSNLISPDNLSDNFFFAVVPTSFYQSQQIPAASSHHWLLLKILRDRIDR